MTGWRCCLAAAVRRRRRQQRHARAMDDERRPPNWAAPAAGALRAPRPRPHGRRARLAAATRSGLPGAVGGPKDSFWAQLLAPRLRPGAAEREDSSISTPPAAADERSAHERGRSAARGAQLEGAPRITPRRKQRESSRREALTRPPFPGRRFRLVGEGQSVAGRGEATVAISARWNWPVCSRCGCSGGVFASTRARSRRLQVMAMACA